MKQHELRALVKDWQKRLGLEHWRIVVVMAVPDDECTYAEVERSTVHDRAVIKFSPWLIGEGAQPAEVLAIPLTDDFVQSTVVHELLHLVTADMKRVFDDLDGLLHRDVYSQVENAFGRAEEHLVDRLAESLVRSWPQQQVVQNGEHAHVGTW